MRTLLTNPKMDPALVARIEASVRRRSRHAGAGIYRPRAVALGRALAIVAAIAVVVTIFVTQRRARDRSESRRKALLDAVEMRASSLTESEKGMLGHAEAALRKLAGPYEGDLVTPDVRGAGLETILAAKAVYVRGLLNDFTGDRSIALAAEDSRKDAFLFCLFDPPPSRDEATLIAKVRQARTGDLVERRTPAVALLRDAEEGLPFLGSSWLPRVKDARSGFDLAQLEQAFAHAPIEAAITAARARYLVAVLDEGFGVGLDGDRAHDARAALVDVASARVLLRVRRRVDPSILSAPSRPRFSIDADGCALALDVRAAITAFRQ